MIAAHLIVGPHEEPFLPALLRSLEPVVDHLIVNDNGGDLAGPNARALEGSAFGVRGALTVDRTPFVDFATARNRTLDLHRKFGCGEWAAFVDADEVHRPPAATIAHNLSRLPPAIAVVDGYTRHYFASFRLYTAIERRMSFFRVTPELAWSGRVHERLEGIRGKRLAIPYVYDHYGAILPLRRQAAKGRLYSGLGQAGPTLAEEDEATIELADFFRLHWPLALRYHGAHPATVAEIRAELERTDGARFARGEQLARAFQPPAVRARNLLRRANFEYRWRGRALTPQARMLLSGGR
jgi:hypothetical protein